MVEGLPLSSRSDPFILNGPKGEKLGLRSGNDRESDFNSKQELSSPPASSYAIPPLVHHAKAKLASFQFLKRTEKFPAIAILAWWDFYHPSALYLNVIS